MKITALVFTVLMMFANSGYGELLAKGTALADARKALEAGKYTKNGLDMVTTDPDLALDFWAVDEGVLILVYSKKSGLVVGLSFTLMDERPKAFRKEFDFLAESFDTTSGKLVLSTKKPQ